MAKARLVVDVAKRLVLSLYDSYRRGSALYTFWNENVAPQNKNIPKGMVRGDERHTNVLFYSTLTDRRQVSEDVYKAHCNIHAEHPEIYARERMHQEYTEAKLAEILIKHRVGVPRQSAAYWVVCRKTLIENFHGNPVEMYRELGGSVEGIITFKKKWEKKHGYNPLPGYGTKISSLYALYLAELDIQPFPKDAFPVDVHVQRIFQQAGAIILEQAVSNGELEKMIRPFMCAMIQEYSLDPVMVAHAFWFLGSKFCTSCQKRNDAPVLCPVYEMCGGVVNTRRYFLEGSWSPEDPLMRKGGQRVFRIAGPLFE